MSLEHNQDHWGGSVPLEEDCSSRLLGIFYSSGVFGETLEKTEAAIEALILRLRPQDRLSVTSAIRLIVRQHSQDALSRAENRMQLAQEVGRIGCFEIDMRDGTSVGTPAFFELYGLPGDRGSWSQGEWLSFIHPEDRAEVLAHLKQVALGGELTTVEYRVVRADGEIRWTASRARIETAADGRRFRAYGIQQDITERKLAELALSESEERHRHFVEVNPAAFWTADASGKIRVANSSAALRFGIPVDATAAVAGPPLVHPEDRTRVMEAWRHALGTGEQYDIEHRMRWGDGEYRWVHARAYPRLDRDGGVVGWYGATEDINERKLAEQRTSWMATHDSLTGLANRRQFRDRLQAAIDTCSGERQLALLLLDLDGFKQVNDSLGHDVGDELLVETARRLRAVAEADALVSRLGGDEFTILVERVPGERWLQDFAGRIVQELGRPLLVRGQEIHSAVSIGIAICPVDAASVSDLLKDADLALYAAKAAGRGCWMRFHEDMREQTRPEAGRPSLTGAVVPQAKPPARPGPGLAPPGTSREVGEDIALALRDLRRRHDYLLSNLPGVVVYRCEPGPPWRMAFVSAKIFKLTGFRASAFEGGKSWAEIVHPQDFQRVSNAIGRAVARRRPFTICYRIFNAAGVVRWLRAQGQGVYEGDACRSIEGFITDVTEQKMLERSVRKAEAEATRKARHLATMLESTLDCVYSLDRDWRITYMNGRARAYFGAGDDLIGKSILKVIPDGRGSVFRECFKAAMERGAAASTEGFLPSSGRWYEMHIAPSGSGITVFFRDISDRKAMEEAQRTASERWRAALDVMPQMVWSMAAGAQQPDFYNDRWYEFTGVAAGACSLPAWEGLLHPEDHEATLSAWSHCRATGDPYEVQYRIRHRSGEFRWIVSRARLERNEAGEHVRWYGTCTDIHERVLQQQDLARSEERVQRILNSVPQIIWSAGPDGHLDFVSNQRGGVYQWPAGKVLGEGWLEVVHPDEREQARASWTSSVASGAPYEAEFRILGPDGDYSWTLVRALPERNEDGEIARWYGTCTDIHQRVLAQAALHESEVLNRGIIEASPDCVWLLDRGGEILFVNEATRRASGLSSASSLVGQRWEGGMTDVPRARAEAAIAKAQAGGIARLVMRGAPGSERWLDVVVAPVFNEDGFPVRLVVISRDITEQKVAEEQAQWAANHDPLTRLPNRFLLQQRLDVGIERAQELGGGFALMMLDVDHLKRVNDGLGHDAGDELLLEFANRLKSAAQEGDTVARLGGDEFAIILGGVGSAAQVEVAARAITSRLAEPFSYGGRMLDCHASIGVSLYPTDGFDRPELMKNADVALYAAKSSARGSLRIFEPAMREEMQMRSSMLALAKDALGSDLVVPYYQPKVDLRTGALAGYEALLRWKHPRKGIQPPSTIAAAFEDLTLAADISDRMIAKVVEDVQRWQDQGIVFNHVAINAAAAEFRRGGFAESLLERLAAASISTNSIQLEVTEAVFLGRGAECVERALQILSEEGVKIALDDFGTGYASLSHLKQFPVDIIKIDRSFVADLGHDRGAEAIIDAVINLGRSLGIEVVAEGIETGSQHDFVVKGGCRFGQGYLYGKAAPAQGLGRCTGSLIPWRPRFAAA
ncbi:MAG TPA: diguanylate cyclase [Allosphingosinicella sp.]|nr:diguanylate cyclase [Allosphingosinicella sp.]